MSTAFRGISRDRMGCFCHAASDGDFLSDVYDFGRSGYLPRVAFNLDKCFHCCHACGKQALTMCMGFGCNAVGVSGCKIILPEESG